MWTAKNSPSSLRQLQKGTSAMDAPVIIQAVFRKYENTTNTEIQRYHDTRIRSVIFHITFSRQYCFITSVPLYASALISGKVAR